jgi:hypothetical protein
MKHTVYISGQMTGLPDFNYPAFMEKEAELVAQGHAVINPAVTAQEDTRHLERPEWHDYIASAVSRMRTATAIHYLENHKASFGARVEEIVAEKMGLEVV